jgi:hypothetical protein
MGTCLVYLSRLLRIPGTQDNFSRNFDRDFERQPNFRNIMFDVISTLNFVVLYSHGRVESAISLEKLRPK